MGGPVENNIRVVVSETISIAARKLSEEGFSASDRLGAASTLAFIHLMQKKGHLDTFLAWHASVKESLDNATVCHLSEKARSWLVSATNLPAVQKATVQVFLLRPKKVKHFLQLETAAHAVKSE